MCCKDIVGSVILDYGILEIGMCGFDSCRLMHQNIASYIVNPFTERAYIDEELLYTHAYEAMRLVDDLVDLELEAVNRIIETVKDNRDKSEYELWSNVKEVGAKGRRAGLGFTGLADAIAMLGLKYDSDEGIKKTEYILRIMFNAHIDSTVDMAIERGAFPAFDRELEYSGNEWYERLKEVDPIRYHRMMKFGRRNISFSTVAPTGTVSILTQTSSGVEPVFMPFYQRNRKCITEDERVDYVDVTGEKYTTFVVVHPKLKMWASIHFGISEKEVDTWSIDKWKEEWVKSPYFNSTSQDIDWRQRVKLQGVIQKYITHSISSTVNLSKETTQAEIDEIYVSAWSNGLKGITVYRDGCREGVMNSVDSVSNKKSGSVSKRPRELKADYYQVKVKGESFIVLVGLLNDKPYEVFTLRADGNKHFPDHKGKITKVGSKNYRFDSEHMELESIGVTSPEERASTLYTSMLLRHGVDIRQITKVAKKVNENITSFSSAMCRILNKYASDDCVAGEKCPECGGDLKYEGGCVGCTNCGYSRCG